LIFLFICQKSRVRNIYQVFHTDVTVNYFVTKVPYKTLIIFHMITSGAKKHANKVCMVWAVNITAPALVPMSRVVIPRRANVFVNLVLKVRTLFKIG